MATCLYANGKCSQCGQPMTIRDRRQCPVEWKPRTKPSVKRTPVAECPHFLGATGETTRLTGCRTCRGQGGVEVDVCGCELDTHPRCVVFKGGTLEDKTIHRCRECQDNPLRPQPFRELQQGDEHQAHE